MVPDIIYLVEGIEGQPIEIVMPWSNYVDNVGDGKN